MSNVIVLMNNGDVSGSLTTQSSVIVIDEKSLLLDGGVRMDTGYDIGMVYNDESNNVLYLNSTFAMRNQFSPVVKEYLREISLKVNKK